MITINVMTRKMRHALVCRRFKDRVPRNLTGYIVTNLINGKQYVGLTRFSLKKRWKEHLSDAKRRKHSVLHRAIRKHGVESFASWTMPLPPHIQKTNEGLNEWEQFLIKILGTRAPNGYNLTDGGENPPSAKGIKRSEEFRAKMRRIGAITRWKPANPQQIIMSYNSGDSPKKIANDHKVSPTTVRRALKQNGVILRNMSAAQRGLKRGPRSEEWKLAQSTHNCIDMTGRTYGRLTVIQFAGLIKSGSGHVATWLCRCVCGNITTVVGTRLRNGTTKSCGCLRKETIGNINRIVGMTDTEKLERRRILKRAYNRKSAAKQRNR